MAKKATYSNNDWRRLGDRIRNNHTMISDEDLNMLQYLRTTYKDPLAQIFCYLEIMAHKVDSECICTCRVKRIDSIISKMIRIPGMVINRAEDIAGCRCIVHNQEQVYKVLDKIKNKSQLEIKSGGHDYIKEPKDGGYKSVHVIVSLKDDNRRIEIQIRTIEQHNWATLVEITDLLFDAKIKEYNNTNNPELYLFHKLLSKSDCELTDKDKYQISDIALRYGYLEKVGTIFKKNYIDVRKVWNSSRMQRKHFFLISTGASGVPEIEGFLYFEEAETAYFNKYLNNKSNKNIVLTHLEHTSFAKISMAYSNYMLTYNETIARVLMLLSEAVIASYRKNRLSRFQKFYKYFHTITQCWSGNQVLDFYSFKNDVQAKRSILVKKEWANSIVENMYRQQKLYNTLQHKLKMRIINLVPYLIKINLDKKFKNPFY